MNRPRPCLFDGAPRTRLADRRRVKGRTRGVEVPVRAGGILVHHANLRMDAQTCRLPVPRAGRPRGRRR